ETVEARVARHRVARVEGAERARRALRRGRVAVSVLADRIRGSAAIEARTFLETALFGGSAGAVALDRARDGLACRRKLVRSAQPGKGFAAFGLRRRASRRVDELRRVRALACLGLDL